MAALELAVNNVELEKLHEQLKALAITYAAFSLEKQTVFRQNWHSLL